MILQPPSIETPHISANELGKYVFSKLGERRRILRDQKFKNIGRAIYYAAAERAIGRALLDAGYDESVLIEARDAIDVSRLPTRQARTKALNNREMIDRFLQIHPLAVPPAGKRNSPRSGTLSLAGVTISVRPEFVTRHQDGQYFSFTKLHFSKNPVSADAAEIVLLLLIKYGQSPTSPCPGLILDVARTTLVDCYARTIIRGSEIGRHRETQLAEVLAEIKRLWPQIQPPAVSARRSRNRDGSRVSLN